MVDFKADMAKVGDRRSSCRLLDYPTFIDKHERFSIISWRFSGWGGSVDPDQFTFLHSSQIAAGRQQRYRRTRTPPSTAELDRRARRSLDHCRRGRRIYETHAGDQVTADAPVVFGYDDFYRAVL